MRNILLILMLLSGNLFSQTLPRQLDSNDQIIKHNGYTLSYNEKHEQPNWVFYTLVNSTCVVKAKRKNYFKKDPLVKTGSATLNDYKGSGYDRGHLKPAGDESCDQDQMNETFYMSNMSPQHPSFNRGIWKTLESYVRTLSESCDSIHVYTGPILTDGLKTIGDSKVSVPKMFYKVIYEYKDNEIKVLAFIIPNKKVIDPVFLFEKRLYEVEKMVGIDFP